MSWYRAGTVAVTNGSAAVTLTGGDALQNISVDDGFIGPDGKTYPIQSIGGAGSFTLAYNYTGSTASGQSYAIIPVAMYAQLRTMLEEVNDLITAYQTIAINAGVGKFAVGSAAAPGVRGSGHEGTGLVWNSDESLSISVNGTIVATIGLTSGTIFRLHSQIFNIATPKADFSITADKTNNAGGVTIGYSFAAGGQGPLKFVDSVGERMRIDANGNVGIATTTPAALLEIAGVSGATKVFLTETGVRRYSIRAGGSASGIFDITDETSTATRLAITAGGNVVVGGTSSSYKFSVKGAQAAIESPTNADGNIRLINTGQDWLLGMLGAPGSTALSFYNATAGALRMSISAAGVVTPGADNSQDHGSTSLRWANSFARQIRPGAGAVIWTSGSGSPEGVVTGPIGSLYTRTDGGANTTLYVKESGTGNTGWVAK